ARQPRSKPRERKSSLVLPKTSAILASGAAVRRIWASGLTDPCSAAGLNGRVGQSCGDILTVQGLPGVQVRPVNPQVVGAESIEQVMRIHIATGDSDCGELGDGRRLRHGGAGELAFAFGSSKVCQPHWPALRIIAK